jgi:hypothetical protein
MPLLPRPVAAEDQHGRALRGRDERDVAASTDFMGALSADEPVLGRDGAQAPRAIGRGRRLAAVEDVPARSL